MDPEDRNQSATANKNDTFYKDFKITVHETVGSASISPSGRDVVLASREGLHIIDLDNPYSQPRHLAHRSLWDVADVQWSPFASRDSWIVSTSNQKALVWNLNLYSPHAPIEYTLHAHSRAITDINFSAHHPEKLATCAVDSFVHCWDLRHPAKPAITFADWNAGATQVKWNRQDEHIIASSHDRFLKIWDDRMGARPLKTIDAHATKIYGIDWNRTRATGIVTCSLDRTIKFWDYSRDYNEPERVIRTSFPVWRARHTPFGWGLLAMPQRGDFNLHLYDRRLSEGVPRDGQARPVHSFGGHDNQVKEFLWRSRGAIDDGMDNRDFQLISWGTDRRLYLHRIDPEQLIAVGHEKGKELRKKLNLTRLGAVYKTFRDEKPKTHADDPGYWDRGTFRHQGVGMGPVGKPSAGLSMGTGGFMTAAFNTFGRKKAQTTMDPTTWLEGVKAINRANDSGTQRHRGSRAADDTSEPLYQEIMNVSKRYKKVKFEEADIHGRKAIATLNGPWGQDDKSVFLRVSFFFPAGYPEVDAPEFRIDRSASAISDDVLTKLHDEADAIVEHYRDRRRGCIEAVITYLLGEKGLAESMTIIPDGGLDGPFTSPADESSSDDEGGIDVPEEMVASGTAVKVETPFPRPRKCSAVWSGNGRLICIFPPKEEPPPIFRLSELRAPSDKGKHFPKHFEVFGRLEDPSTGRDRNVDSDTEHEGSSSGSWTDSSLSSSSDESDGVGRLPAGIHLRPAAAWGGAPMLRNIPKPSSHSSGGTRKPGMVTQKSSISMVDVSDLVPAKEVLAQEYLIFGDGPKVCQHNADVAAKHGFDTLSSVWEFCKHILHDGVPLEIMEQQRRRDPILVLARRSVVRIRRKDSGLDVTFDEPESVAKPQLTGRVKWGRHPLAHTWLIPELFKHYEKMADVQMLAMLSCVFAEPAAQGGMHNAVFGRKPEDLPIPVKAPAFSLDYFPSREVAWSQFQEKKVTPRLSTPATSHGADYFSKHTAYGSMGSSNGPWGGDGTSQPTTPYSVDNNTPPLSRHATVASSLSTSPEGTNRNSRRSNSTLSTAFASFSRPFSINLGVSPPVADRLRVSDPADLSTSAPTSGITWGINTSFGSSPGSPLARRKSNARSASFATHDSSYYSSDDMTDDGSDEDGDEALDIPVIHAPSPTIKLTLKNQHMFDDEGFASMPLLDMQHYEKYEVYRENYSNMLGQWCLHVAQAEVLKFNGMVSYWPVDGGELEPWNEPLARVTEGLEKQAGTFLKATGVALTSGSSGTQSPRKISTAGIQGKPLNPTAAPFVPHPQRFQAQGGITQLNRSSSHVDLQSFLNQGTGADKFDVGPFAPGQSRLLQRATRQRMGEKLSGKQINKAPDRTCLHCWELVMGKHLVCVGTKHKTHLECVNRAGGEKESGALLMAWEDVGCDCEAVRDDLVDEELFL